MPGSHRTETRHTIVDAALHALKTLGYAEVSARRIAAVGGFNQALIFYHFGSVDDLLVAALAQSSQHRLARYQERMGSAGNLLDLMSAARELYREDLQSGHVKVLAELVGAGSVSPELGAKVAQHVEPWLAFTTATLDRMLGQSSLRALVLPGDAAFALAALYLGMELLTSLSGDSAPVDSLFDSAARIATLLSAFSQPRGSR